MNRTETFDNCYNRGTRIRERTYASEHSVYQASRNLVRNELLGPEAIYQVLQTITHLTETLLEK